MHLDFGQRKIIRLTGTVGRWGAKDVRRMLEYDDVEDATSI